MHSFPHRKRHNVQYLNVGDNWQTAVNAASTGATFIIRKGLHQFQSVTPKTNQSFIGEPGAIMSGGRILTNPTGSNPWAYTGQTQAGTITPGYDGPTMPYCEASPWLCRFPEDVFINDEVLTRVETFGDGVSGSFFFDYAADTIYIWDNPAGNVVSTSVTTQAFFPGTATGVLIQGLRVEKYANTAAEVFTIDMGSDWVVRDCELTLNHFAGVKMSTRGWVKSCNIHHNGCEGIGAGSSINPVVEDNTIAYNNYAHFSIGWGAGGSKFVYTDGLECRRNWVHHNNGPGLWTDIGNINTLYENNICEDNQTEGIFHEVSYDAIIRYNTCNRNGTLQLFPAYAAFGTGILVSGSRNVEVYGNTCTNNWNGIVGLEPDRGGDPLENHGTWELVNLNVHDNTIIQTTDFGTNGDYGLTGIHVDNVATAFTTAENHFENNTYIFNSDDLKFKWDPSSTGININKTAWQAYGHDTTGSFTP